MVRRDADRNWHKAVPPCVLLSVTVKVYRAYAFHYHSDHAARSSFRAEAVGSVGRRREGRKAETILVSRKNSKIDISEFREFEPGRTIAKCLLIPRFDRNSQREKEFLDFKRKEEKKRYGKN